MPLPLPTILHVPDLGKASARKGEHLKKNSTLALRSLLGIGLTPSIIPYGSKASNGTPIIKMAEALDRSKGWKGGIGTPLGHSRLLFAVFDCRNC